MTAIVEDVHSEYYEVEELPTGKVYASHPAKVTIKCDCGNKIVCTERMTTCYKCGADYVSEVKHEIRVHRLKNGVCHLWNLPHEPAPMATPY